MWAALLTLGLSLVVEGLSWKDGVEPPPSWRRVAPVLRSMRDAGQRLLLGFEWLKVCYSPEVLPIRFPSAYYLGALNVGLWTLLLLLGCTAKVERRTGDGPLPTLVARRVTATVKREASRLVRLETEHEAFLTTPEHPFATPDSGWISAGELAAGDWVVSQRLGAVRLLSVRSERATREVAVFNLSVASSHAYFVGTDRVLVHNKNCRPESIKDLEARLERLTLEKDQLNRDIEALRQPTPESPRIAELIRQRAKLQSSITNVRTALRRQGVAVLSRDEKHLQSQEAENETARKQLEDKRKQLADLESRPPTSKADTAAFKARKAALEREIDSLNLTYERTKQIMAWRRELAGLKKRAPETDPEREALEKRKKELRADLHLEQKRADDVKHRRKKRASSAGREEHRKYVSETRHRTLRTPTYLADTERPRDALELLEDELADLRQAPVSQSRNERIEHLTDQIETMKQLVEVRQKIRNSVVGASRARNRRKDLIAKGRDTSQVDKRVAELELELRALRIKRAQLRMKEYLLAKLAGTPWVHAPGSLDDARLREFERQLAEGVVDDQQLADIEHALDAMDPTHADLQAAVLHEAEDVDEILSEREELMERSPSPERDAALQATYECLQKELHDARHAVDIAVFELAQEHARIATTQASSSSGATWQQRLRAIEEEQAQVRARWADGMQRRLDSARRQLELMRSIEAFHDREIQAQIEIEIALFEKELQNAGF